VESYYGNGGRKIGFQLSTSHIEAPAFDFTLLTFNFKTGLHFPTRGYQHQDFTQKNLSAMKKIFIWLLITAACAGIESCETDAKPKSLLIGQWQMDSLDLSKTTDSSLSLLALVFIAQDTNHTKLRFSFHENGLVTEENEDKTDSTRYEWAGEKALLITGADSTKEKWTIQKLDSTKLVVTAEDSVTFFFRRVKK
jgi:hypothetical protein